VFVSFDEDGMQRPIKVIARADVRDAESLERIEDRTGAHWNSGGSQRARKVEDIFSQPTLGRGHDLLRRPQLRLHLVEQRLHFGPIEAGDVVLIFKQRTERVRNRCRIKRDDIEFGQRARPIKGLGNSR
jgi:hypothetical protein